MQSYKALDWDSRFFGFSIAEFSPPEFDPQEFDKVKKHAKNAGVKLLVSILPDGSDFKNREQHNLVDNRVILEIQTGNINFDTLAKAPDIIETYTSDIVPPSFLELAERAGHRSRYFTDPFFPNALAVKLYHQWATASVKGDMADIIFIAKDGEEIIGLGTTYVDSEGIGRPSIMAVMESHEGLGLGRSFIIASMRWLHENGIATGRIITQSENKLAINTYKKLGWVNVNTQNIYHVWL